MNDVPSGPGKRFLEGNEVKEFREYIGKINWVAQMTDPTVAFVTHELSTKLSEAKLDDLKRLRKIIIERESEINNF